MLPLERKRFIRNRVLVMCVSAFVFAAAWFLGPHAEHGPVLCPAHGLAGIPCPACGLTRAFCDLAHGRPSAAAAHNAVAFPLAAVMLAALPVAALELARGRPFAFHRFLYSTRLAWAVGSVLCVYYLARLAFLIATGRIVSEYVMTSWTYPVLRHILQRL